MAAESSGIRPGDGTRPKRTVRAGLWILWPTLAALTLVAVVVAIVFRLVKGPRYDDLVVLAAAAAAAVLALRMLLTPRGRRRGLAAPEDWLLRELLESAGPAVAAVGRDGRLAYLNPSAERLLGYYADELVDDWTGAGILAPGEGSRLLAEMQKLCGIENPAAAVAQGRLSAFLDCVSMLPPSMVPGFDVQLLRKDGSAIPVTLQVSALRDADGATAGLVAVAFDQSATLRREQALRESQERYLDLFESSNEMIATLSPAGRFLYANPAWKHCFGHDDAALLNLESFDQLFSAASHSEAAALFRRALDGEIIDRAPLRHHTPDGRVLDFELTLSQRQKAGNPLAIRCLLRDVTQQKQREHRLSLQLMVSQIVSENVTPESAAMRILEALCISQQWDAAILWKVDATQDALEFLTAWGSPGRRPEALIRECMGLSLPRGTDLPGRAWKEGRAIWISDLAAVDSTPRIESALRQEMVSGWTVPVRLGNQVLAVLEFYCQHALREDRETTASIEAVAAPLGQMLARSQERGRAEELYRRQEILLDSVADGICGLDVNGRVSFVNPAAARMLGADVAALAGKPVHELLHGSAPFDHQCGDDCSLRRNAVYNRASAGEDTLYRADRSAFPAEYVLTPILDQGRFSGSVLSFRDISQRYALDRMKDEFISTVSHELRTPLTSIRGALGLLSSGLLANLSDKAANLLRIALTNSDRLVRLINDILDLERIQSGREPLAFRPVQLAEIVRQAVDGMQPVADQAGVQLIHDTTQVEIAADPDRLLQVLTNLLSNAIKFSPANSAISVMIRPGITGVTLSVIDHGRGIPADKLEAVFGRFQQVDASDSRQKGGSGLGLAICRTIVLQHSGRIWAERNPVRGSTFRVFLPYQPIPLEPGETPDPAPRSSTVVLAGVAPESRTRIAEQLTRHGYKIVETATVEQTLQAARESVQAILLDTSLDGMNGFEILPLLRRFDPESRTPVVLLSLDDAHGPAQLPAGVEGWVANPLQEDALLGELARVLCGVGNKARILIVEDDHDLARVIEEVFARESIEVGLAHTLQEAVDACYSFQPHLVVLDIGLPDGNGFNLVDWLRQNENLSRLPLVVYSGRDLSPIERRHLTLGPTHFLAKARVQPQQLEALVMTMLRRSRQMEEDPSRQSSVPNP
ncbi:MAG TPA: PAS domain S-box protein [Terracidiphilus sp.]|jgi:PAS domain S-box-containing protein|nr:PAS domain S-box protein [Terracidiphilus sp.]